MTKKADKKTDAKKQEEIVQEEVNIETEEKEVEEKEQSYSDELKTALERIEELEATNKDLNDRLLRRTAEFENYKKRTDNEQTTFIKYAAEGFILKILPVYDDVLRSLQYIDKDNNIDSLKEGVKLVAEKFTKALEDNGVKKMQTKGEPFDFNLHSALMQQQVEGVPPHTVIEEIEAGYLYKDKVIRHAKVIVSQESVDAANNSAAEDSTDKTE